jgi:bifunctional non-homologous end joining protein LigD
MLARSGHPAGSLDGRAVEPKLDGWRVVITFDRSLPDGYRVRTRRGVNITASLPELSPLAESGLRLVLDGELVASDGSMASFYEVMPTVAARRRQKPLTAAVFDLMWVDGTDATSWRDEDRRRVLDELSLPARCCVVPSFPGLAAGDLLSACSHHGVEGVVRKRLGSRYRPGERSSDWRKVNVAGWAVHRELRGPTAREATAE